MRHPILIFTYVHIVVVLDDLHNKIALIECLRLVKEQRFLSKTNSIENGNNFFYVSSYLFYSPFSHMIDS